MIVLVDLRAFTSGFKSFETIINTWKFKKKIHASLYLELSKYIINVGAITWLAKTLYKLKSYSLPILNKIRINMSFYFILFYLCFHDAMPNTLGVSYSVSFHFHEYNVCHEQFWCLFQFELSTL